MTEQIANRIRQCPTLPALPAVAQQVLELVSRPDLDVPQITRVIARDGDLASQILRTVNSSLYARSNAVSTIDHALLIMGLQSVKSLVLGFSLTAKLQHIAAKQPRFWPRSIYAATAARALAAMTGIIQQEEAFTAALLADVGMLVLHQALGDEYDRIVNEAQSHEALLATERERLGYDHANASGLIAQHWKLPPVLTLAMAQHHETASIDDEMLRKFVETVAVGGRCADVFGGVDPARAIFDVRRLCEELFAMPQSDCDAMLREVGARTKEVAPLFDISIPEAPSYDQILAGAQEQLPQLEPASDGGEVAGEIASAPAVDVQAADAPAPQDHHEPSIAAVDFHARLAEQLTAAVAQSGELSLLLLEIDHLEALQRQYGREIAETVLQSADRIVAAAARSQENWSRLAGGQYALLLGGARRKRATEIAEAIRLAICAKPIACGSGLQIPLTISVGVATYQPGMPLREPLHLLKAAELALFAAKQSGRNCVRVFTLPKPSPVAA